MGAARKCDRGRMMSEFSDNTDLGNLYKSPCLFVKTIFGLVGFLLLLGRGFGFLFFIFSL